jgi:hypothetical protein
MGEVWVSDPEEKAVGVTRRDVLKRAAIAGGTVLWAAPIIQTIAAPAAQAASPVKAACCECKTAAAPLFLQCSVDDPSCSTCVNLICGGRSNFSRYFVGTGCGCTQTLLMKKCTGSPCVQQTCP